MLTEDNQERRLTERIGHSLYITKNHLMPVDSAKTVSKINGNILEVTYSWEHAYPINTGW
jgi:hypothetical protein